MNAIEHTPVNTTEARTAWRDGVEPLLAAFPVHAGDILRAIAFAHRDPFPVPIFITGRPGAGKTTLAQAIAELCGQDTPTPLPQISLASIRKAAQPGIPLVLDDIARATSKARPSMLTQINGEVYASANSPLHAAMIIAATGEQRIDPLSRGRVLAATINRRRADRSVYAQLHSNAATASRTALHQYLQTQIPRISLGRADDAARRLALNPNLEHHRRRNAALHVGGIFLRSLDLDAGTPNPKHQLTPDDLITTGTQAALDYALDNGASFAGDPIITDWILGRRDRDFLYVIPGEIIPFIRAELNKPDLTSNAISAALERNHHLWPSQKQGRSIPRSIQGTLTRTWRLSHDILI